MTLPGDSMDSKDKLAKNTSERDFSGLVNELKEVLSGLGTEPVASPPPSAPVVPPPAPLPPEPVHEDPVPFHVSDDNAAETLGDAAFKNAVQSQEATPDADFWNGNVLGWPEADDTSAIPPENKDFPAFDAISETSPDDDKYSLDSLNNLFPPPPVSPLDEPPSMPQPPLNADVPAPKEPGPPAVEEPQTPSENFPIEYAPDPEPAAQQKPDIDMSTMIPQDIAFVTAEEPTVKKDSRETPVSLAPAAPSLINNDPHEQTKLKPDNMIHVACLYPNGREADGKTFVDQLTEMGKKMKKPLDVTAVFLSSWNSNEIDLAGWEESALLSGADVMFILTLKDDLKLFSADAGAGAKKKISKRLIVIEQMRLRTLYVDILVQLGQKSA